MEPYQKVVVMVNGSDTGAMMRLDDGSSADGKVGNMHKYLGKADPDGARNLATFKEWVGHWTLKREDELKKIKPPEK